MLSRFDNPLKFKRIAIPDYAGRARFMTRTTIAGPRPQ